MPQRTFAEQLIARIERRIELTSAERSAIERLPVQLANIRAGNSIVREGDRPSRCFMIMDGVVCTSKAFLDGWRQITAFHIRQDLPDLLSLHLDTIDNDISAITNCRVGFVDHVALRDLCHGYPRIADCLWRITLIDAAIFRQWVVNVGHRRAEQRIAHLLLEFMIRMEFVGLVPDGDCPFPLTQIVLAEAAGMSIVHVNRSLQSLRGAGLIRLENRTLRIPDRAAMAQFAEFSETYLHLPARMPVREGTSPG